jgi:nitroimidazol reductase NimA-like FMN-containing flavoprotein (pyridoxamine 5'-phosphate oxidase superfamily)
MTNNAGIELLSDEECLRLVASERIGRVAIGSGRGPQIFPVNHVVQDHLIIFRSGPGEKVTETWSHPRVAFEVDGRDGDEFWSVVIDGPTEIRADDDPLVRDALRSLVSFYPSEKRMAITITAEQISGRRFQPRIPASLWGS